MEGLPNSWGCIRGRDGTDGNARVHPRIESEILLVGTHVGLARTTSPRRLPFCINQ